MYMYTVHVLHVYYTCTCATHVHSLLCVLAAVCMLHCVMVYIHERSISTAGIFAAAHSPGLFIPLQWSHV